MRFPNRPHGFVVPAFMQGILDRARAIYTDISHIRFRIQLYTCIELHVLINRLQFIVPDSIGICC